MTAFERIKQAFPDHKIDYLEDNMWDDHVLITIDGDVNTHIFDELEDMMTDDDLCYKCLHMAISDYLAKR